MILLRSQDKGGEFENQDLPGGTGGSGWGAQDQAGGDHDLQYRGRVGGPRSETARRRRQNVKYSAEKFDLSSGRVMRRRAMLPKYSELYGSMNPRLKTRGFSTRSLVTI